MKQPEAHEQRLKDDITRLANTLSPDACKMKDSTLRGSFNPAVAEALSWIDAAHAPGIASEPRES